VEIEGFELHPEFPPDGVSVSTFIPPGREQAYREYMRDFAGGFGVEMGAPERAPNTRRALAVAELARDAGKLREFWDAAMDAHWLHGRDLTDDGELQALAEAVGIDPAAALAATRDEGMAARLEGQRKGAAEAKVAAIPAFLIGDERIVGCQPYERIAAAAERAGAQRRG
jgi:predicted DsbA family dithiol-disulfide isomerase